MTMSDNGIGWTDVSYWVIYGKAKFTRCVYTAGESHQHHRRGAKGDRFLRPIFFWQRLPPYSIVSPRYLRQATGGRDTATAEGRRITRAVTRRERSKGRDRELADVVEEEGSEANQELRTIVTAVERADRGGGRAESGDRTGR